MLAKQVAEQKRNEQQAKMEQKQNVTVNLTFFRGLFFCRRAICTDDVLELDYLF